MDKQAIFDFLTEKKIWHEITEHKAVFNMSEIADVTLPYPKADAKNLFIRDDKKRHYYLLSVSGNKRVDLKEFSKINNTRRLSFASENDLKSIMDLIPGAVTPLGMLNDSKHLVHFFIDKDFLDQGMIGVHPNDNTATVWLKTNDLIKIIQDHGNEVSVEEF